MFYEIDASTAERLAFRTHAKARRGRGVLFATAPFVVYLLTMGVLFALAVQDLSIWEQVKQAAMGGALLTAALCTGCFALGARISDKVEATAREVRIERTLALGRPRAEVLRREELAALAIDPSLRSLGADVLLVAVLRDERRVPIAEGEPHSGQVRELSQKLANLLACPVEKPRFTGG